MVRKFNRTRADEVRILLGLFRVEQKETDVVVSINIPMIAEDGGNLSEVDFANAKAVFDAMVRSLRIVDHSLFA